MIFNAFDRFIEKQATQLGGESERLEYIDNQEINIFNLYPYQLEIFNKYIHENRFVLTMPPGSGKSFIVVSCMRWLINLDKHRKVIIAVPTVNIAKTFKKCIIEYPDNTRLIWDIYNDLCNSTENQKIKKIIKFINQKDFTNNPNERVLITTHTALSQAHMKLQNNSNISQLYNDISIVIDEAHHILYSEDKQKNQLVNQMGNLIRDINGNSKCSLWFVTATPFRGDQSSIIPQKQFDRFKRHNLLLDEHWEKNIRYIQNFEFNFVTYEEDTLFKNIEKVLSLQKRKTIIFCPYVGRLIRNSDKNTFKRKLIKHIKKVWPEANIIDLISTYKRNEKKLMLDNNNIAKNIDIILTLKIFDEGSDWLVAEQCIDLTPTNSLTKQYQRFGRVWRDYLDKNNIYYYSFIPYKDNFKTTEDKRKHVSNSYNTFVGSLLLEEIINPIPVIKKINTTGKKVIQSDPLTKGVNYNNSKKQFIIKEVIKKLTILKAENETLSAEKAKEGIIEVLNNNNINNNHEEIMVYITKLLKNRNRNKNNLKKIPDWKQEGLDLSWMSEQGFDKIWSQDILDGVLIFGTNTCDINHFSEFKKVFELKRQTREEILKEIKTLAENNNGVIPSYSELKNMGKDNINKFIHKHPELIKYPQKKLYLTQEDILKEIKLLAENNNGFIPSNPELKNMGKDNITAFIKRRPELIKYPQDTLYLTQEEILKEIKILAENNNGVIPSNSELKDMGKNNINLFINKHPKLIKYPQATLYLTQEDILKEIKILAKNNNGVIPSYSELRDMGKSNIHAFIKKYPELIEYPQKPLQPTQKDILKEIKILADNNGGVIPSFSELRDMGKSNIYYYIKKHSNLIKYPQKKLKLTRKDILKEIKILAKNNNGVIPSHNELRDMGKSNISCFIKKHPKLIKYPQKKRGNKQNVSKS